MLYGDLLRYDPADPAWVGEGKQQLATAAVGLLRSAEAGSDHQLAWAQLLSWTAATPDQLDLLADLSELLGEDGFRISAYRRAATRIRETPGSVAEMALAGDTPARLATARIVRLA